MDVKRKFLDEVLEQVKFKYDRNEIEHELTEHILEKCAYLRAKGMSSQDAELEAVRSMGDPAKLGKALNEVHNPWIGRLWIASRILIVFLIWLWIIWLYLRYGN